MGYSKFLCLTRYKSENNDLLLFPFQDESTPCYRVNDVPDQFRKISPPEKEGASKTVFAGMMNDNRVIAKAYRLDAKHSTPKEALKKAVSQAVSLKEEEGIERVVVFLDTSDPDLIKAAQEGAMLGGYVFDKYLQEKKEPIPVAVLLPDKPSKELSAALEMEKEIFVWTNFARDVLNEPPNVIQPESLADIFKAKGKEAGLKITVWDAKKLEKEKCGGILSVGKGAAKLPRLVIGEYSPKKAKKHIALVGKGITFDTGGYCLKPANSQIGMKYDMSGAAGMFAAACAIAKLGLPIKITLLAPLAENDISSKAYHTTDVIVTRSGKSVQVDNTDAEGRLILADALTIAGEKKPDWIIDMATLTGACVVALGEDIAGLYATDKELATMLIDAAKETGEIMWELPLHMPYMEHIKTTIADCKNVGNRWGGSITAALFLKQFVPEEIPWAHLDIAGPGVKEEPLGHLGKGAKGFGVKSLVNMARILSD